MSPSDDRKPRVIDTKNRSWTNKHGTYTQKIVTLYDVWNPVAGELIDRYKATAAAVQSLVGDAVRDGVRLRAFGGGWSFSRAPATDGRLVNTKPMNLFFQVDPTLVAAEYQGDGAGLRFVQCGNSIAELNNRLRAQGRSLRTSGASNGQTMAGAASTGTHGSAIDVGATSDYVVGLHLVVGPNRQVWLERDSYRVVAPRFAEILGAELVRDDALFEAALVSFGSFGFIVGMMIETDELFLLNMFRRHMPFDASLKAAVSTLGLENLGLPRGAERPYHFEVLVNPYDLARGAQVTTMYRDPYDDGYEPPPPDPDGFGPGDDALAFIGKVTDVVPQAIPTLMTAVVGKSHKDFPDGVTGTAGEIFTTTTTRGEAASMSMGVPLARAAEAMETLIAVNDATGPVACLFALRFVPRSKATLGFTRFEPTCIVEADGPLSARTTGFYDGVWQSFRDQGIPFTVHWGKLHRLDAPTVRGMYGDAVDRWLDARATLLDADVRRVFSSPWLEELGLAG